MLNRRAMLISGLAASLGTALPARADSDNPMPAELRKALERDPRAPVLGNPKGDITLTEFFDYNCPFCKKMVPEIHAAIVKDKGLRVVFREWAIFGPGSNFAARASLASLSQGKYWQLHTALMQIRGRVEEKSVIATAEKVGLDMGKLRKEMEADWVINHLDRSMELADHMALAGTPSFIAGNEAAFGYLNPTELGDLIARGRKDLA